MHNDTEQQNTHKHSLKHCIFSRIEDEGVTPKPAWRFLCQEGFVWSVFGVSILLGAAAVAAIIFAQLHVGWEFYEATHDNALTFLVETLPHAWIVLLVGMVALAYYQARHSKKGYRYQLWSILLGSVVLSIGGGVILHHLGAGYVVDHKLGKYVPMHKSALMHQNTIWSVPEEGRLSGVLLEVDTTARTATLIDQNAMEWSLFTSDVPPFQYEYIASGTIVRVVGRASSTREGYFHVCALLPPPGTERTLLEEMRQDRAHFAEDIRYVRRAHDENEICFGRKGEVRGLRAAPRILEFDR